MCGLSAAGELPGQAAPQVPVVGNDARGFVTPFNSTDVAQYRLFTAGGCVQSILDSLKGKRSRRSSKGENVPNLDGSNFDNFWS